MNQLIKKIQAEIKSVEAQRDAAAHAGDGQDVEDYNNIINGLKRALRFADETSSLVENLILAGNTMEARIASDISTQCEELALWARTRSRLR